ncbi:MarR family transcriptional regulator [Mycolicibacterium sp.]|uniref:MarR family winged helix-turn-helix transcriptional regulator n=1 Tax=Mycolicibacterium sp. TaxID=2320850 RepID=UPI001D7F43EF|nr:MarR family transcriptional regulator [Mycolicibacterium sp.]MCB1290890.1 MarR family transcriptional regulator [Mycobacterium sp.]MCB9410120.1 MarR family transcriptional regulator [Mycolicibacterium sp.]
MSGSDAPVSDLAADLQRVLSKLFNMLRRGDAYRGSRPELTLAQASLLLTLLDNGPIRMTELAARERVRTPTTTVAIRRLERVGLVKRSRDPSDMRAVLVEVTPEGRAQYNEALDARRAYLASILGRLSDGERESLVNALAPLERLAEAEGSA